MTDFLLELRSEEIPARMQDRARDDLARLFAAELASAGIAAAAIETYATPRRLALIARDLPRETAAVGEETKGPRTNAPPQALDGFLRKTGLARDQLVERDGILFAVVERPGRATAAVLAEAIPAIVRVFPWPRSMRWGDASASTESLRWVRPLQGIVALFGDEIVPCEVAGIGSGAATVGHRFHHPGIITIGSAADYADKLRACHVIVDQAERRRIIALGAAMAACEAGLELVRDEGLLSENAGLTEWPVPLLGRFDPAFLSVPPEVIQLTARVNQKYFVCQTPPLAQPGEGDQPKAGGGVDGELANAFVCTANIDAADGGGRIVEGNRKVLAARLSDARFFYDTDLKVPLEEQAKKLDRIVFHEKLGTLADKVDRVAKLARWLVEEGIVSPSPRKREGRQKESPSRLREGLGEGLSPGIRPKDPTSPPPTPPASGRGDLASLAERAARLCKADLVTGMVGEFPELQGVIGGYYAAAQGEDPQVAAAIRDHYKPVGQGDEVPTDPVTVAVSLADKLDTLQNFFAAGMPPTGSKDPFALRRAALAVIELVTVNQLRLPLGYVLTRDRAATWLFGDKAFADAGRELFAAQQGRVKILDFFADRLKVQQREAGVRHDLIDAVFALGGEDDLVRLLARVDALQSFIGTEDGANLLAGYKRAANILKKEGWQSPSPRLRGEGERAERSAGEGQSAPSRVAGPESDTAPLPDQHRVNDAPRHSGHAGGMTDPMLPAGGERAQESLSYAPEPEEHALIAALALAAPRAAAAVAVEDFAAAMAALAGLRPAVDAFFDKVTVNDADADRREARLGLLARVRDAVHAVADFSRIEG